ncbi:MAG TPA: hypothetical protein VMV32_00670, partial [Ignavibacteriaceae bacterium]|nr:hypothetical protein [Ignavibacteriaceae bacterium]
MKFSFIIILSFLLYLGSFTYAGNSILHFYSDSVKSSVKDSLAAKDTVKKKGFDVDSVIYSSASDSLFFFVNKKKMDLYGNGDLKYKDTDLKGAKIYVNFVTSNVDAYGIASDSLPNKLKDTPVLTQSGEVYNGDSMRYNFKTARGFI